MYRVIGGVMSMKAARLSLIATSNRCGDIGVEVGIGAGIWRNGLPGGT